jgi:hypothetical protein
VYIRAVENFAHPGAIDSFQDIRLIRQIARTVLCVLDAEAAILLSVGAPWPVFRALAPFNVRAAAVSSAIQGTGGTTPLGPRSSLQPASEPDSR